MTTEASLIGCSLDFTAAGKHFGHMLAPHSRNESAWGTLMVPIVSIRGSRPGPTMLIVGGNHGDEYEGQIAVLKLVRRLQAEDLAGQVIAIPALNLPAARADARVSPVDNGNMNRSFPGHPRGGITQRIAHYVHSELLPRADVVVDLHSGGHSLNFVPSAVIHQLDDPEIMRRSEAALAAFGAPLGLVLKELDSVGMLDTAVEEMGKLFISTELGGAAMVTPETVAITDRGLDNLLKHFDMLPGEPEAPAATRIMDTPDGDCFTLAGERGLYEPLVELGEPVRKGQVLGRILFLEDPQRAPLEYRSAYDGVLYCRRVQGWTDRGDCLAVVAVDRG